MSNNFMMYTDEVRDSGKQQIGVSNDFLTNVNNIFSIIESICASEWKGFSADTYNNLTNTYREPMTELGNRINDHAQADINSASNFENLDQELAQNMNKII